MKKRRIIGIILIILGIAIASSPFIGKMVTDYKQYRLLKQLELYEFKLPSREAVITRDPSITPDPMATPEPEATPSPEPVYYYMSADDQMVIGVITIEKIKVKIPIIEGVQQEELDQAIGHMPGTPFPGKPGNVILAGHRSYSFGQFFNRIDELENGDVIKVSYANKTFEYTVYDKLTVLPDETWVLNSNKNESIISLITCTPPYVFSHRLIVRARLI